VKSIGIAIMKPNKEKRFLDFQNILSALRLDNLPIVVEGKRDTQFV